MLLQKNRLKKRKDFDLVYKKGKSVFFEDIFIKFLKNGQKESRIGFSVGVKFSKKATRRNKIKRQLREIIRKEAENLKKGWDIIIIPKMKEGKIFEEIKKKVKKALKKGDLIVKN